MRDAYFVSSLPPTIIVIILTSRGTIHGRKMFNPLSTYDKLFSTHLLQMKWNLFARLIPFMETHYLTFPFLSKSLVINYNVRGRYTVETKTTTSFLFTPGGRVQFPNSFTESYISRAAEVRYPCKILTRKMYSSTHAGNMPTSCVYTRFYCIKYSSIYSVTSE